MKYEAIFFDLDGTVIDTLQNITDAVNHTMRHFGLREFSGQTLKPHLGWGVDYLMRKLIPELSEAQIAEILAYYRPYYAQHTTENTPPYPGVLPMLRELKKQGLVLALISNKPDSAVQPLMELYFRDLLSFSIGEQPGIARKPEPDMLRLAAKNLNVNLSRCLYVGDTEVDIQTARNTGIDCVCVTWGFRTREELIRAGAEQIAESTEELRKLLQTE